jgi:SpoVK/Ycf46/Vps4 family AAA+-type ATPase
MPRIDQLSRLFRAVAQHDLEQAKAIAGEIAIAEEGRGHHAAAQSLRGSLHTNGHNGSYVHSTIDRRGTRGVLDTALSLRSDRVTLGEVSLRRPAQQMIAEIVAEAQHEAKLRKQGIRRRRKLLFHGPPGCGKSMTAQALANALHLPLYVVRFDSVIGSYLGQTAMHLRELFQYAETAQSVLLFDEIDALGKRRGHPSDVGELDRIVIALMQELEFSDSKGLVIATSNLPASLDPALWRRFDLSISFPKPTRAELARFARENERKYGLRLSASLVQRSSRLASFAEVAKFVEDEARRRALSQE